MENCLGRGKGGGDENDKKGDAQEFLDWRARKLTKEGRVSDSDIAAWRERMDRFLGDSVLSTDVKKSLSNEVATYFFMDRKR